MPRFVKTFVAIMMLCVPAQAEMYGPLRVHPQNPRYFTDDSGKAIFLAGSHTWQNFQDGGKRYPPPAFDYTKFLDFLSMHNHNFFRLWTWEQSNGANWRSGNWWISPTIYTRPGPGTAIDGKLKFDTTEFNPAYFERMRQRVIQARHRGMYVAILLFNGWSIEPFKGTEALGNPWRGHPYNRSNNINGMNGDLNADGNGKETHTLADSAVVKAQLAYIRKVIDTVNDLDNVLYEISNESHSGATDWQYYIIDYIKEYEATKPKQHPVGMTAEFPGGTNAELFASPADWIAPNQGSERYLDNPLANDGRKVVVSDTDHLCGVCGTRKWVWKSITRGMNLLFMDVYDRKVLLLDFDPDDPDWVSIRKNLGYARAYADRMNLAAMTPRNTLASTEYCLANPTATLGEYLVYLPSGDSVTVDLWAADDDLDVEWLDPQTGTKYTEDPVEGGGSRTLYRPFSGTDSVLYLKGRGLPGEPGAPVPNPAAVDRSSSRQEAGRSRRGCD